MHDHDDGLIGEDTAAQEAARRAEQGWVEACYLFPDESIVECSNDELLALIRSHLGQAHLMTDGSDSNSDVKSDFSQDLIEQARDVLVARGHVFDALARRRMSFLSWPPTPEEQAEADKRARHEQELGRRYEARADRLAGWMLRSVPALLVGVEFESQHFDGLEIDLSAGKDLPGRKIIERRDRLGAITGGDVRLGYGCSRVGIELADDDSASWSLMFAATGQPELWRLIADWVHEDSTLGVTVWDHRPDPDGTVIPFLRTSIANVFPRWNQTAPEWSEHHVVVWRRRC